MTFTPCPSAKRLSKKRPADGFTFCSPHVNRANARAWRSYRKTGHGEIFGYDKYPFTKKG